MTELWVFTAGHYYEADAIVGGCFKSEQEARKRAQERIDSGDAEWADLWKLDPETGEAEYVESMWNE